MSRVAFELQELVAADVVGILLLYVEMEDLRSRVCKHDDWVAAFCHNVRSYKVLSSGAMCDQ